jgi:hypothetical protein
MHSVRLLVHASVRVVDCEKPGHPRDSVDVNEERTERSESIACTSKLVIQAVLTMDIVFHQEHRNVSTFNFYAEKNLKRDHGSNIDIERLCKRTAVNLHYKQHRLDIRART